MPLSNILSGSAFRLALRVVVIFIIMLLLAGLSLVRVVSHSLEEELKNQILEEAVLFRKIYDVKGRQGLISVIDDLSHTPSIENVRGLFGSNRQHLAGQVSLAPDFIGLERATLVLNRKNPQEAKSTFHANSIKIEKMTLVVGRSTRMVEAARNHLIFWLTLSGLCLSFGTLLLGYLASRRSLQKLQVIDQTLQAFSKGDLQARIKTNEGNGQIDRIARQMNQNLDHLSGLVSGMKSTATAIAHDLKTPLSHARISLFKAMELSDKNDNPGDAIADALDELEQLNQIFDTILRISRIQNQTNHSAFKSFDLNKLLESVVDMLTPIADEAGVRLHQQTANAAPLLLQGDPGMIQQMLINLANNAIVHCPLESEVCLSTEEQQGQIVLIVQDNGPGIPADHREWVLEPFKRLDSARTSPGNGLGLALVKAIVEHHQAEISLEDAQPGLLIRVKFPIPTR